MPRTPHPSSPRACWIYLSNVYGALYFPVCTGRGEAPAHKDDEHVEARNTGQEDGRWLVGGIGVAVRPCPVVIDERIVK